MAGLRRSLTVSTLVGGFALALASCWGPGEGGTRCECGDTPMCGNACTAECGCCPRFASTCLPNGISVGRGSCYEFVPCSGPDRCVVGKNGPVCAESTSDCEAVRADYEARLTSPLAAVVRAGAGPLAPGPYRNVMCPETCRVSAGHCAQGLATCWLLSYETNPELDRIANLYQALGCPALGPCSCPPAPIASCQFDASGAAGGYSGPLTCMVE